MLNLFQHLTKSWTYETLKRVQGDRLGLFTRPFPVRVPIEQGFIDLGDLTGLKRGVLRLK